MGQCCESLQTCLDQMRLGGAKTKPKKEKKQKGLINLNIGFGVMDEYVEEQVEKEKINNDLNYQLKLRLQQLADQDSDEDEYDDEYQNKIMAVTKKTDNQIMQTIIEEEQNQHIPSSSHIPSQRAISIIPNTRARRDSVALTTALGSSTATSAALQLQQQQPQNMMVNPRLPHQTLSRSSQHSQAILNTVGTAAGVAGVVTWSAALYGGQQNTEEKIVLRRKRDRRPVIEEKQEERVFNVNIFNEDRSLTELLSFCSQGLVRQKNCEPPIYTSNYSYEVFCEDTTDHLRSILLRDELDRGFDKQTGANWRLWLGMNKFKKMHQYQIKLTYFPDDPKILNSQEQEFAKNRHLLQKLNQLKGGIVLKVIYESLYRRKIFLDCYDTVHVQVKESAFFSLRTVLQNRLEKDAKYKEEEIMYTLDQLARGLHEAKKMNLPHGNINDECIVLNQETISYKVDGFGFYQTTSEGRIINNNHIRFQIKQYMEDQQKKHRKLFLAPEILKFYTRWIQNWKEEDEKEHKKNRFERDQIEDMIEQLEKMKKQQALAQEDGRRMVEFQQRKIELEQEDLDDDLIDLFKSDIFQLGIVILKMMTLGSSEQRYINQRPDKVEMDMIIDKLAGGGKINYGTSVPGVYPNLAPIVIKMLNKQPSLRPSYLDIIEMLRDSFAPQTDKPAEMLYVNLDLLPKPIYQLQIDKENPDLKLVELRFEKLYNLGCTYIDIKNYQEACLSFEQLLDDENYDLLNKVFQPISILQSQFLLGFSYLQMRYLEEAFVLMSYLYHHLVSAIEQDKADNTFYKILYYLSYINFITDNHTAARNYMNKLIDHTSDLMLNDDRDGWIMCKMLDGQIFSDMGDRKAALSCFKSVKKYLSPITKARTLDLQQLQLIFGEDEAQKIIFTISKTPKNKDSDKSEERLPEKEKERLPVKEITQAYIDQQKLQQHKAIPELQFTEQQKDLVKQLVKNQLRFYPNELIEASYYLGVEYYFEGSYHLAYKRFDKTLKMILQRHSQSMFTSIKLMTLGYLSELNYYFNNIKNLNIYIQKCYDMIQSILRTEGEFLDVLLTWFNKFSFFFTVYISKKEMFQLLEIFQIGLSRPGRVLGHDIVFRDFVVGRSFYFAGSLKHSLKYLLLALKNYNESTKTVKATFQHQEMSSYQIKQEKLARMKQKELEKLMQRTNKPIKSQKYQRPVDRIIVAFCYHWLFFIYRQQNEIEKADECANVYQEIYQIEIKEQNNHSIEYYCNLALIKFSQQDKNCLDYFNNAIYMFEKLGIMHLSLQMLFQYSNLLAWTGLLHLIKREDQEGFYFMDRSLEVFLQLRSRKLVQEEQQQSQIQPQKDAEDQSKQQQQSASQQQQLLSQITPKQQNSPFAKLLMSRNNNQQQQQMQQQQKDEAAKKSNNKNQNSPTNQRRGAKEMQSPRSPQKKTNKKKQEQQMMQQMEEQQNLSFNEEPVAFIVNVHLNVALNCLCLGLFNRSHDYMVQCYEYSRSHMEQNSTFIMMHIDILFLLGYTAQLAGLNDQVLKYYLMCFKLCNQLYEENSMERKNVLRLTSMRDYIARNYIKHGYYIAAQEEMTKSYEEFQQGLKEGEGLEEMAYKQAGLASVLLDTCNYERAKLHIVKAVQKFQQLGPQFKIPLFMCKLKEIEVLLLQQNNIKDKNEGRKLFKDILNDFAQLENPSAELKAMMFRVAATYYLDPQKEKKGDGTKTILEEAEEKVKYQQSLVTAAINRNAKPKEIQRLQQTEKTLKEEVKRLKIEEIKEMEKSLKMAGVFFNKAYEMFSKAQNKSGALEISLRVAELYYQMLDYRGALEITCRIKHRDLQLYENEVILADAYRISAKIYYWTTKPEDRRLALRGKAAKKELKKLQKLPQQYAEALQSQMDLGQDLADDGQQQLILGIKGVPELRSVLRLRDEDLTAADKMEIAFNIYQLAYQPKMMKRQEARLYHQCLFRICRGKLSYFEAETVINNVQEVQAMYYSILQEQVHTEYALAHYIMGRAKMWRVVFYRNYKLVESMIIFSEEARKVMAFLKDKKSRFYKEKLRLGVEFLQTREFINQKKQKMSKKVMILECKQFLSEHESQFLENKAESPIISPQSGGGKRGALRRSSTMQISLEQGSKKLQRQITKELQESSPISPQQQSPLKVARLQTRKGQFMESQHDYNKALSILKQLNIPSHPYAADIKLALAESDELEDMLMINQ